jgi:hypothetical protein
MNPHTRAGPPANPALACAGVGAREKNVQKSKVSESRADVPSSWKLETTSALLSIRVFFSSLRSARLFYVLQFSLKKSFYASNFQSRSRAAPSPKLDRARRADLSFSPPRPVVAYVPRAIDRHRVGFPSSGPQYIGAGGGRFSPSCRGGEQLNVSTTTTQARTP